MLSETRFRKTANRRGHGISFEVKVTFRGICEQQKKEQSNIFAIIFYFIPTALLVLSEEFFCDKKIA